MGGGGPAIGALMERATTHYYLNVRKKGRPARSCLVMAHDNRPGSLLSRHPDVRPTPSRVGVEHMKLGKGAAIGIVGGILAIVGAVMPWWIATASVSAGGFTVSASVPLLGIFTLGGLLALVFGVLGLVMAMIKNKATAAVTVVCGVLALVASLLVGAFLATANVTVPGASASATVTPSFGMWIAAIGGIVLMMGGAIALLETNKQVAPATSWTPAPPSA